MARTMNELPGQREDRPTTSSLPMEGRRQPGQDLAVYLRDYARQEPEMAALWCLGIGFVLGWKLRPW